jgi:hypothetical protein
MVRTKLAAAVPFALVMLGLYAAITLLLFRLETATGSSRKEAILIALKQSVRFCAAFGLSFQIMASSASCMPSSLPSGISFILKFTSFFNADPSAVTYEGCGQKGYPFSFPLFVMVLALGLLVLHGTIELIKQRQRRREGASGFGARPECFTEGQKVMRGTRFKSWSLVARCRLQCALFLRRSFMGPVAKALL